MPWPEAGASTTTRSYARLCLSQRCVCASSQTLAIVISSLAPGAAATKYWNACEWPRIRPAAPPPSCLPQPLLERLLRVDRDRPQVLGELDLLLGTHPVAGERARHPVLLGDLADDRPAPRPRGREAERGGDRRLADAALARHVEHRAVAEQCVHFTHPRTQCVSWIRRFARGTRRRGGCNAATIPRTTSPRAASRPSCVPPRTRSTATSGPPTRSSTARAARPRPTAAAPRWTPGRPSSRRATRRASRSSARSPTPPPATGSRSASCAPTCARCGSTARPCGSPPGRSSSPTWTARPARSGGSWPRCSACRRATIPTSAASALAFQLANFIRDVREDRRLDRVYLPAEDRERFGVSEDDLAAEHASPEVRALVAHEVERARAPVRGRAARRSPSAPASVRPGVKFATGLYSAHARPRRGDGLRRAGRADRRARLAHPGRGAGGDPVTVTPCGRRDAARRPRMTQRATLRGAARTDISQRADVLICGASFAGLAVARELAGAGADVLVVDRYEIGERATSAPARRRRRGCTRWACRARSGRRSRAWPSTRRTARRASGCRGAGRASTTSASAKRCGSRPTPASRSPRSRPRDGDTVLTDRGTPDQPADRRRARLAPGPRPRRQRPAARGRDLAAASRSTRTASRPTSTSGSTAA